MLGKMRLIPAAVTPVRVSDVLISFLKRRGGRREFEKSLASYLSRGVAVTFGSLMRTTYACFVTLKGIRSGTTVILPRYSCPSFAHGILAAGLEIAYCDVRPETLSINTDKLREMDMQGVLAVVCTNLFGLTSPIDEVINICRPRGVLVVEGVDYGLGTEYKNKRIGSLGDVAILNFQEGKAIPVGGGAIATDIPEFGAKYGNDRPQAFPNVVTMLGFSLFSRPLLYGVLRKALMLIDLDRIKLSMEDTMRTTSKETDYAFDPKDSELAVSDFQGRLGLRILDRLEKDLTQRASNAKRLKDGLLECKGTTLVREEAGLTKVHFIRLPVLVGEGRRNAVVNEMLENGIEASPMYVEHGMQVDRIKFPGAAKVADELVTLPCHPYTKLDDISRMASILSGC